MNYKLNNLCFVFFLEKNSIKQLNFELSSSEYRFFLRGWKSPDPCVLLIQSQNQSKIGLTQQSTCYALYRNKSPCSKSLKENPSSGLGWLDPTSSDYSLVFFFFCGENYSLAAYALRLKALPILWME